MPWHEQPFSAPLTLPPLGAVWLGPTSEESTLTRGLAGTAVPARRHVGRRGDELLALLRARRAGRAVPVRRHDRETRVELHERDRAQLALLPPRHRPRAALRLPRPRAVRPAERAPLQPEQAPDRPVREGDRGAGRVGPRRTCSRTCRARPRTPISSSTTTDDADAMPKCVVVDHALRLGGRPAAGDRRGTTP